MAATPSTMIPLGSVAPDFHLPDTISGREKSLKEIRGKKATLIMFICNHCPYVKHLNAELVKVAKDFQPKEVGIVAISSNDVVKHPDDGPTHMKTIAGQLGYSFPYLYDESQSVAQAYDAACTPDFFVYDSDLKLAYRGQFDDSRPGNAVPVTGKDLRNALQALVDGRVVAKDQKASIGCNIKWK